MRRLLTIALTVLFALKGPNSTGQSAKDLHPLGWGAYSRTFSSVFCGIHNQAGLASLKYFSAGVFVQQHFSIQELREYQFALALPTSSGNFSLQGSISGYRQFRRQRLDIAYARKLFDWFDAGIQLDYLNMQVPAYGSAHAFTFALSALFHINDQWHAGFQAFNPLQVSYQELGQDPVPDIYQLGIGYQPSTLFLLTAEVCQIRTRHLLALAFQYRIAKVLSLRGGISTGYNPVSAGITLHLHRLEILLSASYHSRLGLTPGAGFIYKNQPANEL